RRHGPRRARGRRLARPPRDPAPRRHRRRCRGRRRRGRPGRAARRALGGAAVTFIGPDGEPRCDWAGGAPGFVEYHDTEWGFPVADDRRLFEKICLEGFQAGLSWRTILDKRESFRAAFAGFDPAVVATF